jgi:hypothetical protein
MPSKLSKVSSAELAAELGRRARDKAKLMTPHSSSDEKLPSALELSVFPERDDVDRFGRCDLPVSLRFFR